MGSLYIRLSNIICLIFMTNTLSQNKKEEKWEQNKELPFFLSAAAFIKC